MSWIFDVDLSDLAPDQTGADVPRGIKITKTFIDDSTGTSIVTTNTTKEDAKANGGPDFVTKYTTLAETLFSSQLARLLNYENGIRELRPGSDVSLYAVHLRDAVETINYLLED